MLETRSRGRNNMEDDSGTEKTKIRRTSEDVDLISDLPDSVLCQILDFLPTTIDAMRSSFVSKRWESLWTSIPVIILDERHFVENVCEVTLQEQKNFADFVERFITFHGDMKLSELWLRFDIRRYLKFSSRAETWVRTVMTTDARTIDLNFTGNTLALADMEQDMYTLTPCRFPSRSLKVLRIKYCKLRLLQNTSFISLQTVTLAAVKLSDSTVNALISCSPCLEELILQCCFVPDSFLLEAPESHLKCIVVDNCFTRGKKFIEHFSIDIPSLQSFKYEGIIKDVSVKDSRNLIDAEIEENFKYCGFPNHEYNMICELFKGLRHVHSLTLSSWLYIEALQDVRVGNRELLDDVLYTLKHLNLKMWVSGCELWELAPFLCFSPNLETLSIDLVEPEEGDVSYMLDKSVLKANETWDELTMPLEFLLHLKKVEIKGFEGRGNEIDFVVFLLENAEVLEKMVISNADLTARYEKYKNKGNKKTLKQLQKAQKKSSRYFFFLRKASPCAEIVLSWD
ncbi:FBD-associated F-box protein At1g66310-like [Macadamia integrifolia]|uniref:FBD-associated F-box protein At1g66310-like n=1 Tax=Macadamia integrifolia TaxID=60698 RepID=UPI001C4F7FE3|nr:FBD-associated F-box protein At1g66310-like [Macadamia integrifolia]